MSLFSEQLVYCQICGQLFETDFQSYKGNVCSKRCYKELEWRRILSIMGKKYEKDPECEENKNE